MWRLIPLSFLLLFRPSPAARAGQAEDSILMGKEWTLVGEGYQLTADSTVDRDGSIYFTDARKNRIGKIDPAARISIWKEESGGAHGIALGPDGRLYAGQHDRKRIVALDRDGKESVVAEGVQTHHLTVSNRREIYFAEPLNHTVWLIDAAGKKRAVTREINWPHGLRLSPDQARLFVTDSHTRWVEVFEIQGDGSLANGKHFCHLEARNDEPDVDTGGMAFDTEGFLYVATNMGVQVFDRGGRLAAILDTPATDGVSAVLFGGPNREWLYITNGDKMYRHLSKRRGAN
jgi:sugar lactone lactonase YvrE